MMGLLFLLSGIWFGQEVRAPEFTKFDFVRERVGHKVLVEGTMLNRVGGELADVKLTSIYYDGNREPPAPRPTSPSRPIRFPTSPGTSSTSKSEPRPISMVGTRRRRCPRSRRRRPPT
jgi:hypothetical protein